MEFSKINEVLKNELSYRVGQANHAVFEDLIESWDNAVNLPKNIREKLHKVCPLEINSETTMSLNSDTVKTLIVMSDGKKIETVLMRHKDGRNTVCVSCQVGCPMACSFCATGKMGLLRNLTSDEIATQVLFFSRLLKKENKRVSSVGFMGMGEPFRNYDNVLGAVRMFHNKDMFNIGARHISISTCGLIEGIEKLSKENLQVNLAISLHASNDLVRRELMPVARMHAMPELLEAIDKYIEITNRKVMFEYVMIDGVNDLKEQALELVGLMAGKLHVVNLIPYNDTGVFKASSKERMETFKKILENNRIEVTLRHTFGDDIQGACGQLATKKS